MGDIKNKNTIIITSCKTVNSLALASVKTINGKTPCLVAGTLVEMADGRKIPIEKVKIRDKVKTYNVRKKKISSGKITWVQEPREVKGYYKIEANDGMIIRITGEHPMFIMTNDKNGKFIEAKKVKIGQKFLNSNNKLVKIKKKEYIKERATVHNISIDKYHNYFGAGMLCHNGAT